MAGLTWQRLCAGRAVPRREMFLAALRKITIFTISGAMRREAPKDAIHPSKQTVASSNGLFGDLLIYL